VNAVCVGIDIGTTSIKSVATDEDAGTVLASAQFPTPWRRVLTGREMNPSSLRLAVLSALSQSLSRVGGRPTVVAIGVASFGQSGTLVDKTGEPLAPFVSWEDSRFDDLGRALGRDVGPETFAAITGLAPAGCWSANHLAALQERHADAAHWLGVAEWVVMQLGGRAVAELSLASESGLLDVAEARWSPEIVAWATARDLMPELVTAGEPLGVSRVGGLNDAVLTVAGHDHAVGSVGASAAAAGVLYDSAGTSETLVRAYDGSVPPLSSELILRDGLQVGRHVTGGIRVSTSQRTTWALNQVLEALGEGLPPAIGRSTVVTPVTNVMSGSPVWDGPATADSVWLGAMEAVADSVQSSARLLDAVCGPHHRAVLAGGWAGDDQFVDSRRRRLHQMSISSVHHPGALGAAQLAAAAAGVRPRPE
jgi:sugar (pentulose or hexulose) kinase